MKHRMRILLAEEDTAFVDMIQSSLKATGDHYDVEAVSSGDACLKKLKEDRFDILLLDHALSDGEGLKWLRLYNELGVNVPTVFISATGDPQMSIQAMQEGVYDYINRSSECAKAIPFVVNRVIEGYNLMTQKVRLQKELIEAKNFLESVIGNAGDAISVVDREGKVIYWNEGAKAIYGYPRVEALGRRISDFLLPADEEAGYREEKQLQELMEQVWRGEVVANATARRRTKDGREIIVSMTITPLRDAAGAIVGASRICKDITEQKKTEEKMLLAERLSCMGELIAGVAHEIRNPLAGIKINAQILARGKDRSEMEKQLLDSTLEGIGKIQKIVEDMLDYARPKAANYKMEDINQVVEKSLDVLNSQMKKGNIVVSFARGEALPQVRIDEHQIEQVLINIMLNAVHAMDRGGMLVVRTFLTDRGALGIEVKDTGTGIPATHLKKIFDPFFTTKSRGTGLGLSITLKLLENHGARIEVASEEGEGSVFTITFPKAGE
ncbi:MAG: PAS domain S-box protein [Smithellaceae bacterium]|nr:PAS domain S-box protein [Smithellaceae bacterium]